jgi:hypothetical protein
MAKKAGRSTPAKLNSGPDRPENISEMVVVREATSEPSDEEIRARAYQMYLERGANHGLDLDDWVRAERELRQRR